MQLLSLHVMDLSITFVDDWLRSCGLKRLIVFGVTGVLLMKVTGCRLWHGWWRIWIWQSEWP